MGGSLCEDPRHLWEHFGSLALAVVRMAGGLAVLRSHPDCRELNFGLRTPSRSFQTVLEPRRSNGAVRAQVEKRDGRWYWGLLTESQEKLLNF